MITPIENNGMVLRTQDYSALLQSEENHSSNQHVQIQNNIDKNGEVIAHSVQSKDDSNGANTKHDAKEEGRNKYVNLRKAKNGNDPLKEGIVVVKGKGGFDLSI